MAKQLTAAFVNSVKDAGKYFDGGGLGLILRVDNGGYKRWVQRIRVNGRQRDLVLGAPPRVSLAEAREKALANNRIVMAGGDPFAARFSQRNKLSFRDAAEEFFAKKKDEFRSDKHSKQWMATVELYAIPLLGRLPVDEITVLDVRRVLEPIWSTKTTTASRLRQRIEAILSWATVAGYREGDNPARWKGNLAEVARRFTHVEDVTVTATLSPQKQHRIRGALNAAGYESTGRRFSSGDYKGMTIFERR